VPSYIIAAVLPRMSFAGCNCLALQAGGACACTLHSKRRLLLRNILHARAHLHCCQVQRRAAGIGCHGPHGVADTRHCQGGPCIDELLEDVCGALPGSVVQRREACVGGDVNQPAEKVLSGKHTASRTMVRAGCSS
jgi:hypothetical protein